MWLSASGSQALTLRWWTETSSEFVVGRHGATGNTSKLVATDRQHQRGSSMAARKSPCPDIAARTWQHWASWPSDLPCARQWLSILGFGVGRSIWACKKPSSMQSVYNAHCPCTQGMQCPCPHDGPTVRPLGRCKTRTCSARA